MKFEVVRENLSKALNLANKAISVKASLPILQNVLVENDAGRLKIVATDLDKSIITWVGAKIEGEASTTIPAKALYTFINGLKEEHVKGEIQNNNLVINTDKAKANFNGTSSSDYPTLDYSISKDHFVIDTDLLKRAVDETYFSTSIDESTNPEWTGLLLTKDEASTLHLVGLDGYRMSQKNLDLSKFEKKNDSFEEVIIPAKNLVEVVRLASNAEKIKLDIQKEKSIVVFDLDDLLFVTKTLEGNFPDYKGVIPKDFVSTFKVDYEEFLNAIKLSSVFAGDNNAVRINIDISDNQVEVLSDSVELGSNKFEISIEDAEGENIDLAFKAKYLIDYLNNVPSDKLIVKVSGQQSPCVFIPQGREDYLHLAVPLQPYWEGED